MSSVRLGVLRPLCELAEAHDLDVGFLREVFLEKQTTVNSTAGLSVNIYLNKRFK